MTATLIDGRALATNLRARLAAEIAELPFKPSLAVVLVGDDPASAVYVRNKDRAATACGIAAHTIRLHAATTQSELLAVIARLNNDPETDAILVQLPLPDAIDTQSVLRAIDPAKDVDGLTPTNAGLLAAGRPFLVPCTPLGVIALIDQAGIAIAGARAVVLGRSVLVGKPVAALLTARDATVTLAHSRTRNLQAECSRAEILVVAVGRPELVQPDWILPGACVIDVGINRTTSGHLVGDVATAACAEIASAITPVPGGVGPMTIACLLQNTLTAALARRPGV